MEAMVSFQIKEKLSVDFWGRKGLRGNSEFKLDCERGGLGVVSILFSRLRRRGRTIIDRHQSVAIGSGSIGRGRHRQVSRRSWTSGFSRAIYFDNSIGYATEL